MRAHSIRHTKICAECTYPLSIILFTWGANRTRRLPSVSITIPFQFSTSTQAGQNPHRFTMDRFYFNQTKTNVTQHGVCLLDQIPQPIGVLEWSWMMIHNSIRKSETTCTLATTIIAELVKLDNEWHPTFVGGAYKLTERQHCNWRQIKNERSTFQYTLDKTLGPVEKLLTS